MRYAALLRGINVGRNKRVGMPADEVLEVADTVIIRPDPEPAEAS